MAERTNAPEGPVRKIGVAVWLVLAALFFAHFVGGFYALGDWLFFRYAAYLAVSIGLVVCTTLLGNVVVHRIAGSGLPLFERLVAAVPVGLTAFALCWALLGFASCLSKVAFFVLPLLFAAGGIYGERRSLRRLYAHRRGLLQPRSPSVWTWLVFAYGVLGLLLIYVPILTPDNLSYDARWYHMGIAETYAATGSIRPFREGWMVGAMPQLVTYLYAWAFELPGSLLFDRIELCAHLEFVVFVATLPGLVVVARRVLPAPRKGAGLAWVCLFFFPELFLYDSNLIGGADHVAALWAAPLFLTFLRAQKALAVRPMALFGVLVAGLLHTKYTAAQLLVFPSLAFVWRLGERSLRMARTRQADARILLGPAVAALAVVLLWAPHWLKNWVFYRNPFFPMAEGAFHSRPWVENAPARLSILFSGHDWQASHNAKGVLRTLRALADFSFLPNDWDAFHGDLPIFGSLFTLTVPCLLFLRRNGKLWALYAMCHGSILFWFWTAHQDRYLQVTVPLMAAAVAVVLSRLWTMGLAPRVAAGCLVALQLAWGADVPFIPTHAMLNKSPFRAALDLVGAGYKGKREERFKIFEALEQVGAAMPKNGVALVHDEPLHLGIARAVVSDVHQTGIDYTRYPAPDQMYDALRALGVTHLVVHDRDANAMDSVGADVAFQYFFHRYGVRPKRYGSFILARMPADPPTRGGFHDRVLFLGCENTYDSGIYSFEDLHVPAEYGHIVDLPPYPTPWEAVKATDDLDARLPEVDAVVWKESCFKATLPLEAQHLKKATKRDGYEIWVKTR